jgi:hypothetical protein
MFHISAEFVALKSDDGFIATTRPSRQSAFDWSLLTSTATGNEFPAVQTRRTKIESEAVWVRMRKRVC